MTWGSFGEGQTNEISVNMENDMKVRYNIHYEKDVCPWKSMDIKNLKSLKGWDTGPAYSKHNFWDNVSREKTLLWDFARGIPFLTITLILFPNNQKIN